MNDAAKTAIATSMTVALILAAWQGAIAAGLPDYVLPSPAAVATALHQGWIEGTLHEHAWFTVRATAIGFAIGVGLAIVAGALVAEFRPLALAVYPLVIATQSMPTVAIAPLIVVYFGVGTMSKVVTVALLCFFPVFVNMIVGIRATPAPLIDLYRAAGSGRARLFFDVKLPAAVDHVMAGVQVAVVLAFVGCVVSEFVASSAGLGFIIRAFANDLNVAVMFAAIISLGMIGAIAAAGVRALHSALVPWRGRRS